MASDPLFGVVPTGQPLITEPASTPSPTSFLYNLSGSNPFSHILVFLLPGVNLPPNTAAAIYLTTAADFASASQNGSTPSFKFLGAVGPGKESAIFSVGSGNTADLVIGVDIESEEAVANQLREKATNRASSASESGKRVQPSTAVLAQRIIQNAFNFLTSFSGTAGPGGVEVVPLKAFEEWWKKFESRVRADPSFLEQQQN